MRTRLGTKLLCTFWWLILPISLFSQRIVPSPVGVANADAKLGISGGPTGGVGAGVYGQASYVHYTSNTQSWESILNDPNTISSLAQQMNMNPADLQKLILNIYEMIPKEDTEEEDDGEN